MSKIVSDGVEKRYTKLLKDNGITPPETPKLSGLAASRTGSQRILHYCENTLAARPYFAGDTFTAADIMMHFPIKLGTPAAAGVTADIKAIQSVDQPYYDEFPNVKAFMQRLAERPAYQRAMQATMPAGPPPF